MPRNVYSEINLHFVWHTKESRHLIKPETEKIVYDIIRTRTYGVEGAFVHEIGGMSEHVHLIVTIPPLDIPRWIGRVKGGSSHDVNQKPIFGGDFEWQTGYGVVCFGTKDLPWVAQYVRDQKRHHRDGTCQPRLERTTWPEGQAQADDREGR
jgi:putative transposase